MNVLAHIFYLKFIIVTTSITSIIISVCVYAQGITGDSFAELSFHFYLGAGD